MWIVPRVTSDRVILLLPLAHPRTWRVLPLKPTNNICPMEAVFQLVGHIFNQPRHEITFSTNGKPSNAFPLHFVAANNNLIIRADSTRMRSESISTGLRFFKAELPHG